MANYVYTSYRNVCVGKTSDYTARKLFAGSADSVAFTAGLYSFFDDEGAAATATTDVFQSTYTAGEMPSLANKLVLGSVTTGTVAAGVLDAADALFTGASALTGTTQYENYILFKYDVTAATAAGSAVLCKFDTATGLPITANSADVTVVFNASGIYKF